MYSVDGSMLGGGGGGGVRDAFVIVPPPPTCFHQHCTCMYLIHM